MNGSSEKPGRLEDSTVNKQNTNKKQTGRQADIRLLSVTHGSDMFREPGSVWQPAPAEVWPGSDNYSPGRLTDIGMIRRHADGHRFIGVPHDLLGPRYICRARE